MNLKYLIKYFWHVHTTITISKSGLAEVRGKSSFCTVTTPTMNNSLQEHVSHVKISPGCLLAGIKALADELLPRGRCGCCSPFFKI